MTNIEIEAWTLRVIDQVSRKEHAEDARVELKAEWPEPVSAARLLAGHANAARGTPILWIIGVDEEKGVVGAPLLELANWFPRVKSNFDGPTPSLHDLNVPVNGLTVVALLFSTDRSPFVVKNRAFGQPGGGPVKFEVPWREGRKTETARREHLIRLLAPASSLPDVEWLECSVHVENRKDTNGEQSTEWHLYGHLYLSPTSPAQVVIPFHRTRVAVEDANAVSLGPWNALRMRPPQRFSVAKEFKVLTDSATVTSTNDEVIASGPGKVRFETSGTFPLGELGLNERLTVSVDLRVVGGARPIVDVLTLLRLPIPDHRDWIAQWALDASTMFAFKQF